MPLWNLSDRKIVPNYSFYMETRGLSDKNFITAWNLAGIMETWHKHISVISVDLHFKQICRAPTFANDGIFL